MQTYSPRVIIQTTDRPVRTSRSIPRPRVSRQRRKEDASRLPNFSSGSGSANTINRFREIHRDDSGRVLLPLPSTSSSTGGLSINRGGGAMEDAGAPTQVTAPTGSDLVINRGGGAMEDAEELMQLEAQTGSDLVINRGEGAMEDAEELMQLEARISDIEAQTSNLEAQTSTKSAEEGYLPWIFGATGLIAVVATVIYVTKTSNRQ